MTHILGKRCSFSSLHVLFVSSLFVSLVIYRFGFGDRILVLVNLVHGHCLLFSFAVSKFCN